jgi:HEAT repeat protein
MSQRPGRRAYLLISLFALMLVLFPFLFWYLTWFGRKLTDAQIDQYLSDKSSPRHGQHALVQIGERLSHHRDITRWYPAILDDAANPSLEIRQTAAWIMGQDRKYEPFHEALLRMIHDDQPMVRRNAALALSAFGDAAARPELVAMLHPSTITAPAAGPVKYRLKLGDYVNPGTMVGRVGDIEVRAALPGEVRSLESKDGVTVHPGDPLADLSVDENHVWEALRALYLVGDPSDLDDVERFVHPIPGMREAIQRQASLTVAAIQARKQ